MNQYFYLKKNCCLSNNINIIDLCWKNGNQYQGTTGLNADFLIGGNNEKNRIY